MLKAMLLAAGILVLGSPAHAIDDTPGNRAAEAQRYVQVMDVKSFWTEMASGMVASVRADQRQAVFNRLVQIDLNRIRAVLADGYAKVYTADELAAMTQFFGSPIGKSVLAKTPQWYATISPGIQQEVQRAMAGQ